MVKDPICGMEVNESQAPASLEYKGQKVFFCSSSCYDVIDKDPERYVISEKQGWWTRFLGRLSKASEETYGHTPPKCH
jgi:YHS domain-containing protein